MNFKDHEKKIQSFLKTGSRKSQGKTEKNVATYQRGVYVISRFLNDDYVKIGNAHGSGGLFQRLKSYKICYPFKDEYFLQYLFICPSSKDAEKLEKHILSRKDKLHDIGVADVKNECVKAEGRYSKEYRCSATKNVMNETIMEELNKHKDLWSNVVIFGKEGWKIKTNKEDVRSFQRNTSSFEGRPKLGEAPQVDTFIPGVLQIGDDGWVAYIYRSKLIAKKGLIVRATPAEWITKWKGYSNTFTYPKNEVFATETEALKYANSMV